MNKVYQNPPPSQEKKQRNLLLQQQIKENIKLYYKLKQNINIDAGAINKLPKESRERAAIKLFEQIATLNNSDLSILNYIRKLLNLYPFVNPAQLTIALKTYYSRQTINKCIKKLVRLGLLIKVNVRHGKTCLYALPAKLYLRELEAYLKKIMPSFGFYNNKMYKTDLESLFSSHSYYTTNPNVIHNCFTHINNSYYLKASTPSSIINKSNLYRNMVKKEEEVAERGINKKNLKPQLRPNDTYGIKNNHQEEPIKPYVNSRPSFDVSKEENAGYNKQAPIVKGDDERLRSLVLELNNSRGEDQQKMLYLAITSDTLARAKNLIANYSNQLKQYKLIFVSCEKITDMVVFKELVSQNIKYYFYIV